MLTSGINFFNFKVKSKALNIRGKPMVNTRKDAWHFEDKYGVKVFS